MEEFNDYENRTLEMYYKKDSDEMKAAKEKLKNGIPLAYVVGECAFYDEMYTVNESVLVPRGDTERVVDKILSTLKSGGYMADLCTGSGNIAISVLCHSQGTKALLVDISEKAISVAKENAERNGVIGRCTLLSEDLHSLTLPENTFDVIASNPPYVRTDVIKTLEKECQSEPYIAFDGGKDGMDFYRLIVGKFSKSLKKDGKFIFEIGYDQREDIMQISRENGFLCDVFKDYGKNDRVAILYKESKDSSI